jgi:hypothetical protein
MHNPRNHRNLAHEIGLCRIALVVEQVHQKMQRHHAVAKIFYLLSGDADQRARLTYFWWVVAWWECAAFGLSGVCNAANSAGPS